MSCQSLVYVLSIEFSRPLSFLPHSYLYFMMAIGRPKVNMLPVANGFVHCITTELNS